MATDATFSAMSATPPPAAATCTAELTTEASTPELGFAGLPNFSMVVPALNCTNCQNTPGSQIQARRGGFSRDNQQIIPLQSFYQGHVAESFTQLSKSTAAAAAYRAIQNTWRAEWESNDNQVGGIGNRVSHACYEYIYEKYYDWGRFVDATAPLGDDFRAYYDAAFTQTPVLSRSNIGRRGLNGIPLQQRDTVPTEPGFAFSNIPQPKNVFFLPSYRQGQGTASEEEFAPLFVNIQLLDPVFAPYMLQQQDAAPSHTENWAWHDSMGQALLPNYLDHEFEFFHERVVRFRFLLSQREKLTRAIFEYTKERFGQFPTLVNDPLFDPTVHFDDLLSQLADVDPTTRGISNSRGYRATLGSRGQRGAVAAGRAPGFRTATLDVSEATALPQIFTPGSAFSAGTSAAQAGVIAGSPAVPYVTLESIFINLDTVDNLTIMEIVQLARAADALIEEALMEARDIGCLDLSGPTPCDWTPRMFKESLGDPYTAEREVDFQRCIEIIGGDDPDFSELANDRFFHPPHHGCPPVPGTNPPQCKTSVNGQVCSPLFRTSARQIEFYLDCFERWLIDLREGLEEQIGEPIIDDDGNLQIGKMSSDATEIGSDMFGANFSFMGGWGLTGASVPDFDNPNVNFCALDPYILGSAQASATIFYQDVSLVDALLDVQMQSTDNEVHLELLGETIFTRDSDDLQFTVNQQPASIDQTFEEEGREDETFFSFGTTFLVVWVPVSLEAGLRGFIGLRGGAAVEINGCQNGNLALGGHLTPFAGVEGYAEASIDALVVEAGITGVLEIVRVDLPLVTGLTFRGTPTTTGGLDSNLAVSTSLDLVVSLLSGYFAAFVEICYIIDCERIEAKIFSWEGPKLATNLFETNFNVSLEALDQVRKATQ